LGFPFIDSVIFQNYFFSDTIQGQIKPCVASTIGNCTHVERSTVLIDSFLANPACKDNNPFLEIYGAKRIIGPIIQAIFDKIGAGLTSLFTNMFGLKS
jgi:hypothetical protein